jgi:hypothetical protein
MSTSIRRQWKSLREEKLEFEHRQLLDIGKFFYDGLFKFASLSFLLNGVLLSALAFLVKDAANSSKDFFSTAVMLVGWIGVVYNGGVICACTSSAITAWNLTERFNAVDRQLGLHVADRKSFYSDLWGTLGWIFVAIFFALWIAVWVFLVRNRMELLHATITTLPVKASP